MQVEPKHHVLFLLPSLPNCLKCHKGTARIWVKQWLKALKVKKSADWEAFCLTSKVWLHWPQEQLRITVGDSLSHSTSSKKFSSPKNRPWMAVETWFKLWQLLWLQKIDRQHWLHSKRQTATAALPEALRWTLLSVLLKMLALLSPVGRLESIESMWSGTKGVVIFSTYTRTLETFGILLCQALVVSCTHYCKCIQKKGLWKPWIAFEMRRRPWTWVRQQVPSPCQCFQSMQRSGNHDVPWGM